MQRIYLLKGKVQHYNWGGFEIIPALLGLDKKEQKPFAEYWMGDHPSQSSSIIINKKEVLLHEFIKHHGEKVLGRKTMNTYNGLPYLFKILDVRQMLSIQVHPSKDEAEKGFNYEELKGIPITASQRNYKDRNHKPEMMVALSDFWLLHGFKEEGKLLQIFSTVPEVSFLTDEFNKGGLVSLFAFVMQLEQEKVNHHLQILANRILPLYANNHLDKLSEDFWAARAINSFCANGTFDRGIFCIYLFNLLHLKKGEGVFQPAGMPHAYLEGQNMEIMANSDNVLRAGLTDKHIDVAELLKHTICDPTIPNIFSDAGTETEYPSSATEFSLHKYQLNASDVSFATESAEILIVLEGSVEVKCSGEEKSLTKGESAFLIADSEINIKTDQESLFFRATVGSV